MKKLLTIIATLSLFALVGTGTARAQVTDAVVADIPFEFTVDNATLPAGRYTIKPFGAIPENLMAIASEEGKILRVFIIHDEKAKEPPHQAELLFHRVGDRYFLHQVFDQENGIGAELRETRVERRLETQAAKTNNDGYVTVAALTTNSNR